MSVKVFPSMRQLSLVMTRVRVQYVTPLSSMLPLSRSTVVDALLFVAYKTELSKDISVHICKYRHTLHSRPTASSQWLPINCISHLFSILVTRRPILRLVSEKAAKILARAFISSHLDYCNSTLYSIIDNLLQG